MFRIDLHERPGGQDAPTAEGERLEELAFESEVQASLTRHEVPVVTPPVDARLRALLGSGTD
jgi:hypothetical protein